MPSVVAPGASLSTRGFATVAGALPPACLEPLREAIDTLRRTAAPSREILYTHRAPSARAEGGMTTLMDQWINPHRRGDGASTREAARSLRPLVHELLGDGAVLFQDVLMDKRQRHRPFPWHQDFPFWPVDRPHGVIVWVALDPVDESRGGLRLGLDLDSNAGPPIDLHTGGAQPGFERSRVIAPERWVSPVLDPGDAIAFSPLCWHSSGQNQRAAPRRVWASTWLAADARWCHAAAPRHPYLRHFEDAEPVGARGWAPLLAEAGSP